MQKTEILNDAEYNLPKFTIHEHEYPNLEARLAISLVVRWGIVAAESGSEDSTGRAKLRRMTPAEVVTAACDTARLLTEEIRKRAWMVELPSLVETVAAKEAAKAEKAEERRRANAQ